MSERSDSNIFPRLIHIIAPDGQQESIEVDRNITTVGRSPMSDIRLNGYGVLDHHAEIVMNGGRVLIRVSNADRATFLDTETRERVRLVSQFVRDANDLLTCLIGNPRHAGKGA